MMGAWDGAWGLGIFGHDFFSQLQHLFLLEFSFFSGLGFVWSQEHHGTDGLSSQNSALRRRSTMILNTVYTYLLCICIDIYVCIHMCI